MNKRLVVLLRLFKGEWGRGGETTLSETERYKEAGGQ